MQGEGSGSASASPAVGAVPALTARICCATAARKWGCSGLSQGLTCSAGTETSIDSQLTYESLFGDLDIVPVPACAAHEGDSPTYNDIRKMQPNDRKKWKDALENEITGLFLSSCVKDRNVLEDSLPSSSPLLKKASKVIDSL